MKESELERRLVQGVDKLGGIAYKFVSPGNDGVPDRVVVLPGGQVFFVELKTDTGRLRSVQKYQLERLCDLGARALVVRGDQGLQDFLKICWDSIWGETIDEVYTAQLSEIRDRENNI